MQTPLRGIEGNYRITITGSHLKVAVFFALPISFTRKRVCKLLERDLIPCKIFFKLILDIIRDHFFVLSYCIHEIPSAPEVSAAIPIF